MPNGLNLTRAPNATSWDNKIVLVEILAANKSDIIPWLRQTSSSTQHENDLENALATPARYARVVVDQGATEPAGLYEYIVGPLPSPSASSNNLKTDSKFSHTSLLPLTFPYTSSRNYIHNPLPDYESVQAWFATVGASLFDILSDILNDTLNIPSNPNYNPNAPPAMGVSRPTAFLNGTVSSWASFHSSGIRYDAWSLLPQGLYCRFDISGRDSEKWSINEWYYNGILYESTDAFRKAWESGTIVKSPPNLDGQWAAAEPESSTTGNTEQQREKEAPIMIQPFENRYDIDEEENHVSWMGFTFYFGTKQATGVGLWDIRFKGESVMYELGLQEAMAHYAGNDPMQIAMVWLDTLYGMGYNMYSLVPGYDCPSYATYLHTSFYRGDKKITRNNTICVFEYTADHALQRHSTPFQVSVSRNTYLVVRSVSTVGNYDYTIDYTFYLDGTIEVKVRASGYIFGAYHLLEQARHDLKNDKRAQEHYEYGYRVRETLTTSMHDHVINFKADLDIVGESNTMYRVSIEPYQHQYEWEDTPRHSMRLTHTALETETGLDWPPNAGAMYIVFAEEKNIWGERRGYRIAPGTGMGTPPHLTVVDSEALVNSASWAYRDLWLLKQHDHERKSASEYNGMEPQDPIIDFSKMVDAEKVMQDDLVIYFNLGSHHVPHSGDIPNTLMHTSSSSVMFIPHNFHDRDPSRLSAQGVRLDMRGPGKGSNVTHYGAQYKEKVKVAAVRFYPFDGRGVVYANTPDAQEELEPDLHGYNAPDNAFLDNPSTGNIVQKFAMNATEEQQKAADDVEVDIELELER